MHDARVAVVGRLVGIAVDLADRGNHVVLVTTQPARPEDLEACRAAGVEVVPAPELGVIVTARWLEDSYRAYHALRGRQLDIALFEGRGGLAYCACRAKETGRALHSATIAVAYGEPTLLSVRRGAAFVSKRELGEVVTERLVLELCDALVADEDVRAALEAEGWRLPPLRVAHPVDVPAGAVAPLSEALANGRVAVVVPFYDRYEYLPHCLDALARQTYAELEVIVADDGSTVPAAKALLGEIERRTWPWPLRVERLPHGGASSARNGGWRATDASSVVFLDHDDVAFPELVDTLVAARAASGADVVVAGGRTFAGAGDPTPGPQDKITISFCHPRELSVLGNHSGGPVCLWERTWLERLGGFRATPSAIEDWDLLVRAEGAGARITSPPDPLFWYRRAPGSSFASNPRPHVDPGLKIIAGDLAERLPADLRLLPLMAAGAYEELARLARDGAASTRRPPASVRRLAAALRRRARR